MTVPIKYEVIKCIKIFTLRLSNYANFNENFSQNKIAPFSNVFFHWSVAQTAVYE